MASHHNEETSVTDDDQDAISSPTFTSSSVVPSPPAYRFTTSYFEAGNAKTRPEPTWAVNYDSSRLLHTPTFLAFQEYYDSNGDPLQVLPPFTQEGYINVSTASEPGSAMSANGAPGDGTRRRFPCYNQVADAYVFQQTIDERLRRVGVSQAREDNMRLAGVQWIDNVRRALRL